MFAGPCNMLQEVGFSPSLSKTSVKCLPHTHKKDLVKVYTGLNLPLVVKRQIGPLWEGERRANVFIIIIPKYLSVDHLQHKALLQLLNFHRRVQKIYSYYVTPEIVL